VAKERAADYKKWKSPALFLSPATNAHGNGRLNPRVINTVSGIKGRSLFLNFIDDERNRSHLKK